MTSAPTSTSRLIPASLRAGDARTTSLCTAATGSSPRNASTPSPRTSCLATPSSSPATPSAAPSPSPSGSCTRLRGSRSARLSRSAPPSSGRGRRGRRRRSSTSCAWSRRTTSSPCSPCHDLSCASRTSTSARGSCSTTTFRVSTRPSPENGATRVSSGGSERTFDTPRAARRIPPRRNPRTTTITDRPSTPRWTRRTPRRHGARGGGRREGDSPTCERRSARLSTGAAKRQPRSSRSLPRTPRCRPPPGPSRSPRRASSRPPRRTRSGRRRLPSGRTSRQPTPTRERGG